MTRRPIDPPEIPAWRRAETRSEDETPTLTSLPGADVFDSEETQWEAVPATDSVAGRWGAPPTDDTTTEGPVPDLSRPETPMEPQPLGKPPEDPRELARRLAAEAKAKIAARASEQGPSEDPRELAKRLAEEAKARTTRTPAPAQRSGMPDEDPRALAKRLAAEAKARLTPGPTVHRDEDPRELAKRLAAEAKAKANTADPAPSYTPPVATKKASEAPTVRRPTRKATSQAPPASNRAMSAKDILEAALRGNTAPPEASPAPTPPAPEPAPPAPPSAQDSVVAAPVAPTPEPEPEPEPAPAPAPPTLGAPPAAVILDLLPGAAVESPMPVERPEVFQAVWRAHRTRALHERDFAAVAMASVLIDAADRVALGKLVGARVTLDGTHYAVFADLERRALLAVLSPAEVYLAGLGAS